MSATRRLLIGNVLAAMIALSAVLTQADGPLDWFGVCVHDEGCKTRVRILVIISAFLFKFAVDFVESSYPLLQLDKFRTKYLDSHLKPLWEALKRQLRTKNVRLNIMVPRRTWYGRRIFRFQYPLGFDPPYNKDKAIRLHVSQGLAGQAFRAKTPIYYYFNEQWAEDNQFTPPMLGFWKKKPWGMSDDQRKRTAHVRFILSVPMLRSDQEHKTDKVRGVINLDVTEESAASRIAANPDRLEELTEDLLKIGKLCAYLW